MIFNKKVPAPDKKMKIALKKHIMRKRQRLKQELEQEENSQFSDEKLGEAMTIDQVQEQLKALEEHLENLKGEKHDLFVQLKRVLNEDDSNKRFQKSNRDQQETSENTEAKFFIQNDGDIRNKNQTRQSKNDFEHNYKHELYNNKHNQSNKSSVFNEGSKYSQKNYVSSPSHHHHHHHHQIVRPNGLPTSACTTSSHIESVIPSLSPVNTQASTSNDPSPSSSSSLSRPVPNYKKSESYSRKDERSYGRLNKAISYRNANKLEMNDSPSQELIKYYWSSSSSSRKRSISITDRDDYTNDGGIIAASPDRRSSKTRRVSTPTKSYPTDSEKLRISPTVSRYRTSSSSSDYIRKPLDRPEDRYNDYKDGYTNSRVSASSPRSSDNFSAYSTTRRTRPRFDESPGFTSRYHQSGMSSNGYNQYKGSSSLRPSQQHHQTPPHSTHQYHTTSSTPRYQQSFERKELTHSNLRDNYNSSSSSHSKHYGNAASSRQNNDYYGSSSSPSASNSSYGFTSRYNNNTRSNNNHNHNHHSQQHHNQRHHSSYYYSQNKR